MKHTAKLPLLAVFGTLIFGQIALAATYKIDADHTAVSFKIRHLLTNVQGHFKQFDGQFDYEPGKPETWTVSATIQAASIDTNVAARDKHLRSADFFDVEQFPTLAFTSTGMSEATETTGKLNGTLTLHGVSKPVTLDLQILGIAKDPWGNVIASFTASTKINRKDFGLTWNKAVESGQLLVGEEVEISLEVAGLLQTEPAAPSAKAE